jgi:hypothetical protein
VAGLVDDDTDVVITTLLDSDDCFHSEMIAAVRSYAEPFAESGHERLFVNFPRGYRYDESAGRLYSTSWMYGPFSSLFERVRPGVKIRTINSGNHNRFHHHTAMHFDYSVPAWMQVIHGLAESTAPLNRGDVLTGGNKSSLLLHSDIEVDLTEAEADFGADLAAIVPAGVADSG